MSALGETGESLLGFVRDDGTFGVRNHTLMLPSSMCATSTCQRIASEVPGCVALDNHAGCGQSGADLEQTFRTLCGFGLNPNVSSVLVVGLGCEALPAERVATALSECGKTVGCLVIQEEGGTVRTIKRGVRLARQLVAAAEKLRRVAMPIHELTLGLECGGSDATSGLAANPVLGIVSDRLVLAGGTAILSETTECIGAESILAERAANWQVRESILAVVGRCEKRLRATGEDFVGSQPSPGNIAGGLSTIEEKSLGCVHKAGTAEIQGTLAYAERVNGRGLYFMDTPGVDVESVTGLVAGGCQAVVFTTGRGTGVGCAIAPVIKITANHHAYANMSEDIDLDVSKVVSGKETLEASAERLWNHLITVLNGQLTRAEDHGYVEFGICRIGPSY